MSDIEKEAFRQIGMTLVNEYRQQRGLTPIRWLAIDTPEASAFIRSIQLHEKTKKELQGVKQELADFKQKVSDIVRHYVYVDGGPDDWEKLTALIIPAPKPDPLFDVLWDLGMAKDRSGIELMANRINETLDARGLEIREKNDGI